eukprot:NODE_5907_length_667_cov_6.868932_g4998_i0.p2 GENE.NODE_5907_length_667_cov_6.868932_g4998_i0~~NODE_5907_length_667_cov_6.868932_g4998_i0.p2  ORF type:complete len:76 (-),score=4.31 NODE_5907_length_667_cov_6.868932_g4998_i0:232-459(-)
MDVQLLCRSVPTHVARTSETHSRLPLDHYLHPIMSVQSIPLTCAKPFLPLFFPFKLPRFSDAAKRCFELDSLEVR